VGKTLLPLALLLVGFAPAAHAQSAEQILKRHADALGGAKALESIQSTTVTGRVRDRDGRSGTFTHSTARAGRLRVELSVDKTQWRWGFNGRSAWQSDSRDGLRTLAGAAAARVRNEASCAMACGEPVDTQRRAVIAERGRVRERPVLVVDTIMPDGFARTLSFDAETYLLLKQEEHSPAGTDVRVYGDYRRTGRVLVPHEIEWERDGQAFLLSVDRVTHDAPVDEAVFAFAATGGEALPDMGALLADVRRSQERLENVFQSYAHTWTRTTRDIDGKGRVTKEDVEVFEVFYLAGTAVRKLVQRNGQPLSAKDAREERERVDDVVRDYERRKRQAEAAGGRERVTVPLPRGVPTQDRWISGLLRMCEFSNLRRERLGGRPMIVAEFEPRRGVAVNDGLDAQMSKTAGVMWIDEQARQVVRTDAHYRENDRFTRKGSATTSEQVRLNDEVWLPSYAEMNLSGQLFFGKSIHRQAVFRQSDYRKFNVDSDYKIDTPDPRP
jgi:hypothetical protein